MKTTLSIKKEAPFKRASKKNILPTEQSVKTITKYHLEPTDNPKLFREVDEFGDWTRYYNAKEQAYKWSLTYLIGIGFPMDKRLVEWLRTLPKEESDKILKFTGDRGSRVHAAIRDLIDGVIIEYNRPYFDDETKTFKALTFEEYRTLVSWTNWVKDFQPQVILREHALDTDFYAFTLDFFGRIILPKGAKVWIDDKLITINKTISPTVILDWKYTSRIKNEHKIQITGQSLGLPKFPDFVGIVRIGTNHTKTKQYEMKLWSKDYVKQNFEPILNNCIQNFKFLIGEQACENEQLPVQLQVKIPKMELVWISPKLSKKQKNIMVSVKAEDSLPLKMEKVKKSV